MPATATYPKQAEPIFSSRQDETPERGQVLEIKCYFPDGSFDAESARLGDYGCFVPAEEISECEERLTRTLHRRAAARLAEAKASTEGIVVG